MVLISHRKQFIYVKNVKVAGTSVEAFFERFCLDPSEPYVQKEEVPLSDTVYGIRSLRLSFENEEKLPLYPPSSSNPYYNHMCIKEIQNRLGDEQTNRYFKFCVVRNPYDKIVSYYKMMRKYYFYVESFETFCETDPKTTDDFTRYSLGKTPVMDFYIRFEYLHDDLKTVCQLLDVPYDEQYLPHYKKTRSNEKSYRSFYNEKTKKIIYQRHKKEFDQFGYQF